MKINLSFALFATLSAQLVSHAQSQPGSLLWSFDLGAGRWIGGDPAIGLDGTVYVTAVGGIYAVTNSGITASNKWVLPGAFYGPAAISADGTVYAGDGSFLRAVGPEGTQKWAQPLSASACGAPAIALDGTVSIVADGVVRAFAPAGVKKWTLPIDGTSALSRSSPVIGSDGTLYTSSLFTTLYAITPEGSRKWARPDGCGDALPTPTYEGRVYAYAPTLSALTPAGSNQWSAGGLFGAGPSIGPGGTIYLVEPYGVKLHALSSSGQRLWEAIPVLQTNVPATTPAVDCAGTVYHCTSNAVFALSPQGAVLWTFSSGYPLSLSSPVPQTSPAIGPDGTIYATVGSTLYALYNTNKLANSSWPMFRQNPRRTGSVERPVLKQPQKRSDGGFHFQLYAQPGQALDIQTTADFVTWGSLTNLVVTNPPMDVLDLTASNADLRYYRAASPP